MKEEERSREPGEMVGEDVLSSWLVNVTSVDPVRDSVTGAVVVASNDSFFPTVGNNGILHAVGIIETRMQGDVDGVERSHGVAVFWGSRGRQIGGEADGAECLNGEVGVVMRILRGG